jgi:ATP-binding cassette subfamily C protein CydD
MFYDTLQGIITLILLGRQWSQAEKLNETSREYRTATLSVLRYTFLSGMTLELIATISTALVAVEVGLRLLYGHLEFQNALFLLILAPEFYLPLRMLGVRYHAGMSGIQAAKDIFAFLEIPEPVRTPKKAAAGSPDGFYIDSIHLEGIYFRYPQSDRDALIDFNLTIPRGKHTAIVGPSGAGKTTVVNLLMRFLDPDSGKILIGETPFSRIDLETWRRHIAWVPQTPTLFHGTLAENIALSDRRINSPRLEKAIFDAELNDLLLQLPDGLQTRVGERGFRLSSGQAQCVAIARAFYKDSPFLILDEPTSSMDPLLEEQLEKAIQRIIRGRTVLTIAHRLPTVYRADQVVYMNEGKVKEEGKHSELLKRNGPYAQMVIMYTGKV